jgi:diguanylate cyclase (GGDEF)-like protein/PAS domain S-box-containing protein
MAETLTGWSRTEAQGRRLKDVLQVIDSTTRDRIAVPRDPSMAPEPPTPPSPEHVLLRRDGSETAIEYNTTAMRNAAGRDIGTRIVLRDVSASRALEQRLAHLASHDSLTDLPNRSLLADRLARSLALAHRHGHRVAVLFRDIDHFKWINDTRGHLVGDALLRRVGEEVSTCVRSSDTVSRYGGDEFVIVLAELQHAEDSAKGVNKIMTALAAPHTLGDQELRITVSIGISVYPDDGENADTLLTRADIALYHAKEEGRDGYRFFEPRLNARAVDRQVMEAGLRRAVEHQEFELVYQPKFDLRTNAIVGAEALLRWRHQDGRLLQPAAFLSIAEDCGLMGPIGHWVIENACRQARAWQDAGYGHIPVAINISAAEFRNPHLLQQITDILRDIALDPSALEIEFTEDELTPEADATRHTTLRGLHAFGVQLALDGFGAGRSSLQYVRQFPLDALKIGTSFVEDVHLVLKSRRLAFFCCHLCSWRRVESAE